MKKYCSGCCSSASWSSLPDRSGRTPDSAPSHHQYLRAGPGRVLSASTRNTINAYGSALQQKTKAQIVVLTVPTLGMPPRKNTDWPYSGAGALGTRT